MRRVRYAVALVVVVDFLVAVVQMQQAIVARASFKPPSVTTYGQYAVTMTARTADDVDLYVRDPHGDIGWYGALQTGALSLEHDTIPGVTDPVKDGEHELMVLRESSAGEYVANVLVYKGGAPAVVTVELWDLRGFRKHVVYSRSFTVQREGQQATAFRWTLNARGEVTGHSLLPADLLRHMKAST
ncbi:MAG TPA: hypothetical protein VKC62_06405 [Gaiellaceae bacterium]|nr:hypothetical protein [Gaiellaceae bacterium]